MTQELKFEFTPIGLLNSCFTEKFGVPRQSLMVKDATGILKLNPHPSYPMALSDLETFSHLWIVFVFHKALDKNWRPKIEPPKLDGKKRVGVFASRSPDRPNPIGLSVVKLERIDWNAANGIEIHLSGVDILDGTPVLDIKPYLPYCDIVPDANSGWANTQIPKYSVTFSAESLKVLEQLSQERYPRLRTLIEQMLEWDPRPTSQRRSLPMTAPETELRQFAMRLYNLDIHWEVKNGSPYVFKILVLN